MSTKVVVGSLPLCDICKHEGREIINTAKYDGATTIGPWANMCEPHFNIFGIGLGTGAGQMLILKEEK